MLNHFPGFNCDVFEFDKHALVFFRSINRSILKNVVATVSTTLFMGLSEGELGVRDRSTIPRPVD